MMVSKTYSEIGTGKVKVSVKKVVSVRVRVSYLTTSFFMRVGFSKVIVSVIVRVIVSVTYSVFLSLNL